LFLAVICYIGCGSIRGSKIDLGEVEAEVAQKFMKEAIYQARLAHSSGQVIFISHYFHGLAFKTIFFMLILPPHVAASKWGSDCNIAFFGDWQTSL
jgi:hypothetical protein